MKSTFAMLRDQPDYPELAARLLMLYLAVIGLIKLILSSFYLTRDPGLELILRGAHIAPGMDYIELWRSISTVNGRTASENFDSGFRIVGMLLAFECLVIAVTIGLIFFRNRRAWWLILGLNAWFLFHWLQGPGEYIFQFLLIGAAIVSTLLLLLDPRIKAYFSRGPLAHGYPEWKYSPHLSTPPHSPWRENASR